MIALPLAILWIGAVLLAMLDGRRRDVGYLAAGILLAGFLASAALGIQIYRDGVQEASVGNWPLGVGITLRVDWLGITFACLSLLVLIAALLFEVVRDIQARVFPALVVFMAVGLTGLFFTGDAFNFYVFFEISMISAYVMAGYGETPRQFRAALIFIVVNLLGSVMFLIGISSIYHITGWLDMTKIAEQTPQLGENSAMLTATIIFVAFGIKLGLFPFHFWLPAVYTGTRPAVAAILSGALANIGTYGLLRFGAGMFPRELQDGRNVLIVLGAASILYGGVQAIARHTPSEVLAYSAIGQVGYILIALAIGGHDGYAAVVLFAVLNSLNKVLLFFATSLSGWIAGTAFAVGAFSVAGVPPAGGFFGKLGVLAVSVNDHRNLTVALVFVGSALSFIYMFQLYRARFWIVTPGKEVATTGVFTIVATLALLILLIGLWPEPLLAISSRAADALIGGGP